MQCTLGELLLVERANPKVMVNEGKKKTSTLATLLYFKNR